MQQKILNQNLNQYLIYLNKLNLQLSGDESNINNEILNEYFRYQSPSNLLKDLYYADKIIYENIVNNVSDVLIKLSIAANRKEITKNENPEKVIDIVEDIFNFKKSN